MSSAETELVIFDCDGVLVDSEPLSIAVLVQAMREMGVEIDEEGAYERFLGKSIATMVSILETEFNVFATQEFLDRIRSDLYARYRSELKPIDGIADTLDMLDIRRCVASSSQLERIRLSLGLTGIQEKLEPHIFSASMVKRGKPAPDLFLHAAREMGVAPERCVVVEDSPAGIIAARAAGMRVLVFTGGSHTSSAHYRAEIDRLSPEVTFDAMRDLIQLVRK